MSDQSTAVLAYLNEHRQQLRQSETQRSVLTNYLLAITAGLSGFIVQQQFARGTLAVALLIVGLGCTARCPRPSTTSEPNTTSPKPGR
ncbi:hypothetical protein [Paractinoplanes hotanensis]|uniref:Uncharacterized protein n=1 Tax=Paractinoplanes hotanensis TaxID=2906497 RepID=A0ABT0Y9R7_9ACTN|nr:hypothetical protein [Actinoplanes hotanensis]MCM4082786.1 hypothetical protein [Actinoplanes hotanensis]